MRYLGGKNLKSHKARSTGKKKKLKCQAMINLGGKSEKPKMGNPGKQKT